MEIKKVEIAYIMWFFGLHYIYLEKPVLQILFWFTFGGLGVWWIIDLFTISDKISKYNNIVLYRNSISEIDFRRCHTCGKEIIWGEKMCKDCKRKITSIVKEMNQQLDLFDDTENKKEKKDVRYKIIKKIEELEAFDIRTLKKVIKMNDILDVKKHIQDLEEEKILKHQKNLLEKSPALIELIEKAEKYNFIKDLDKERLIIAEILYFLRKNKINNIDFKYIEEINKDKELDTSLFSVDYLVNRLDYLEEVLDIK